MYQSNRYADPSLREQDLMTGGRHVLCACTQQPKKGCGYLQTAGHYAAGVTSLRQAEQCWREGADPMDFARDHREFARAFESFPADADRLYPGWRDVLDAAA